MTPRRAPGSPDGTTGLAEGPLSPGRTPRTSFHLTRRLVGVSKYPLVLLAAILAINTSHQFLLPAVFPLIKQEFRVSDAALGLLAGAYLIMLVLGSLMTRIGYFVLGFTLDHWRLVLSDPMFINALWTTFILGLFAAVGSPLLFSLIAYILVRTRLPGRWALDLMIWVTAVIPGILSGLGLLWLFLGTPGLSVLYGTLWALFLVVLLQGKTTGVNIMKGVFVQIGPDMEEAARVAGAGWIRTYLRIWLPLLMPTLALLAVLNFTSAAGATAPIILLASRETMTLSLLALELSSPGINNREAASIISIFIIAITVIGALGVRALGLRLGVRHDMQARQ